MALFSSPRESLSVVSKPVVGDHRTLATKEPVNGIRIVTVENAKEAEHLLSKPLPTMVWRLLTRMEKGEIELFKLVNNVGNDIAVIATLRHQKFIEGVFPIKDELTTAKAINLLSEAVTHAGYSFMENLDRTITDSHGNSWKLGRLPGKLELNHDWSVQSGGVIDMPKVLLSTANVQINTTTIRKRFATGRIDGNLDLSFSQVGSLTGDLEVGLDLIANDADLLLIEDGAKIGRCLRANGSRIEWFSAKIMVGMDVDLGNTPLKDFDEDVTVNGRLRLDNVPAIQIGRGLTVKKDAILTGAALHALPKDSLFEADVYTDNPDLILPRSTHILGRVLMRDDIGYRIVAVADMRRV
jgi:hypothetical protein